MSSTSESFDLEVVDLEPTQHVVMPEGDGPHGTGGIARLEGSLAGETHELRRRRVAAAAVFIAGAFAAGLAWLVIGRATHVTTLTVVLTACRGAIAAGVAAVLLSRMELSRGRVVACEYLLFGGIVLLAGIARYFEIRDLLLVDSVPQAIASMKNGVFTVAILIIIYGMFIPNDAITTAKVVATMALVPVIAAVLAMEHPGAADVIHHVRTADNAGSNVFFLMVSAALAVYGSYLFNGLRSEVHAARKLGQYRLVRKLGAGGMGEVYLAEHSLLKRPCAVKLIRPESGADPIALARFEREVQSSARLAHHNTIEIYDYGHSEDGTFYYVMQYLRGLSLAELVAECGPLPAGRVIYVFRQVCAGLAEAHELGLVHRDLKPANIFVAVLGGEADVVKVLDFGLVKLTADPSATTLTADLTVSGTPLYMAPEQATGQRELDARADVYALGATMYYALTGRPPFDGASPFEVLMAHARDPIVPPSKVHPGIPADLEAVVVRCLSKQPGDRYPTARALSQDLAQCAAAADWGPNRAEAWWAVREATAAPQS